MSAPTLDRALLVKLTGMFGSDHAGERANAAAAADRLVRQAGLRWPDVILPALPEPKREREVASDEDAVEYCVEHEALHHQRYLLTSKQRQHLAGIVEKLRRAEARATP